MEELKPFRRIPTESIPGDVHTAKHDGLHIDVYRLIHMTQDIPAEQVEIRDYLHQMGDLCWNDEFGKISPEFVVQICKEEGYEETIKRYPSLANHVTKIQNSDYSFPVIIYKGWIIDGMHRLAKAVIDKQTTIKAVMLEEIPAGALMQEDSDSEGD